ncbi:GNAT family N-acetyltransferase [Iamia sp. SCSIO 61187]|uniref:GNAT family N-acetyltransferase n=1 Tax=Iamia sp. SCSIO 61187 TaxID=2722752 RepID=UPI001C628406|nr:GNAT family N-acetyltransferase [Iamia sp. SCSIO 61187]QYG92854.1 GNAT family N-acetyltransferase [Iamia sp. SCSIO 61187]
MADTAALEIRTLDPGDLDQVADLGAHSFGGPRLELTVEDRAAALEDTVAAYRGRRLVGTTAVYRYQQWFGGRAVPCSGIAGVMVAPDQRGSGLARRMLAEAAAAGRERGEPISALYPTTASLYRSVGYEIAGWWAQRAVAVADLPRPTGEVAWEPIDPADPAVAEVAAACAAGRDGWIVPPDRWWRSWARRRTASGTVTWTWVGRRAGSPVAVVSYGHQKGERALFDLDAALVVGVDGPGLTDALAFFGANGTTGDRVRTTLPGALLARHVPQASRIPTLEDWPWMLRILDLPGAVAARGWPAGLDLEVHLSVTAPSQVPDDPVSGDWVLRVADGAATCAPGGSGAVEIAGTDLAALYSGHLDPAQLLTEGRLGGATEAQVSGLRAAFAGSPTLPQFF